MARKSVPTGDPTVLSGFDALTTDVLTRALTRRGLAICSASPEPDHPPGCLVVSTDPSMPVRLEDTRAAWPHTPIVAVVPFVSGPLRQAVRRTEVAAAVPRSAGLDALEQAIRVALAGGRLPVPESDAGDPLSGLTERETYVLRLISAGQTNDEIGRTLGISPHTARTHVQNLMAKLGVRNRLAAAAVARDAGLHPRSGT